MLHGRPGWSKGASRTHSSLLLHQRRHATPSSSAPATSTRTCMPALAHGLDMLAGSLQQLCCSDGRARSTPQLECQRQACSTSVSLQVSQAQHEIVRRWVRSCIPRLPWLRWHHVATCTCWPGCKVDMNEQCLSLKFLLNFIKEFCVVQEGSGWFIRQTTCAMAIYKEIYKEIHTTRCVAGDSMPPVARCSRAPGHTATS